MEKTLMGIRQHTSCVLHWIFQIDDFAKLTVEEWTIVTSIFMYVDIVLN
jgi:hypothetical protein